VGITAVRPLALAYFALAYFASMFLATFLNVAFYHEILNALNGGRSVHHGWNSICVHQMEDPSFDVGVVRRCGGNDYPGRWNSGSA